ncbi:MAG: NADH-quinone oxidoreductase subunit NuoE [Anaerolineaceae bacterium]|nr:NADH-quinone oxidoreductase subunit NuoE [Anaerolineaceae bacterium]
MLSDEEKQEIQAEIPNYAEKQSVCIDALKIVQKQRGWVSDEAVQDLAEFLEMSADELDSVATFYNLIYRQPVGKHVVMLCNSISCWVMGYEQVYEHLTNRLGIRFGETSANNNFTLLPTVCLGICDHAPAMMIDEEIYIDLNQARVDETLAKYR